MATAIKVIGVGGGGCNVIKSLISPLARVNATQKRLDLLRQYVVCNSDIKSLDSVPGDIMSVQIGEHLTRGFGCGGDVRVGARAAEEGFYLLKRALKDAQVVFIVAGLGGGCGTGAAPIVAQAARAATSAQTLIIGVVSCPFTFEGKKRSQVALGGISKLSPEVDNLIIIEADRTLQYSTRSTTTMNAFRILDEVMAGPITAIAAMLNGEQYDQGGEGQFVDLADIKMAMKKKGEALLAIGKGKSAYEAAQQAIANRLRDISGPAQAILLHATAAPVSDFNDAINLVARQMPESVVFPALDSWEPLGAFPAEVTVTLIATGIQS